MDAVPLRDLALLGFPLSRAHLLHLLPARPGAMVTIKNEKSKTKKSLSYDGKKGERKKLKPKTSLSYADNQAPMIISLWSGGKVRKTISLRS